MTDRYEKIRKALAKQLAVHPAITHCDNCGCDWLDNGLNPVGCPYCKQRATATLQAEVEALRAERDALAKDAARYAIARRMSPQQWADAWKLNHRTGKPFDEIIDDLAPFFGAAVAALAAQRQEPTT